MKYYKPFFKKQIRFSSPIILGQLTTVLLAISDNVMVGNYDNTALAAAAFANSVIFIFATFGIGLTFGLKPPIASAYSSQNYERCSQLLQNGLILYASVSILMWLGFEFAKPLLWHLKQPQNVVVLALPYYRLVALSIIPWFLFMALQQFSEALTNTRIPMYANIFSCVINIGLNYVLIFGEFGFPEYGLVGAGIATLAARTLLFLVMLIIVLTLPAYKKFTHRAFHFSYQTIRKLASIGVPIGFHMVFESGAFGMAAIMAGWISEEALAAHQIALNISFVTFMVALGLAQGTTVNVANLVGKSRFGEVKPMGRSAVALIVFFMITMAGLIFLFREQIPAWYLNESDANADLIAQMTIGLLFIVAVYQLADGVQVISAGNLRGLEDTKVPTMIGLISYWIIGIPLGYVLAFVFDIGLGGIWWGLCAGLSVAAVWLTWRFERKKLSKKSF